MTAIFFLSWSDWHNDIITTEWNWRGPLNSNFYNQPVNLHSRANRAINEDISLNLDNFKWVEMDLEDSLSTQNLEMYTQSDTIKNSNSKLKFLQLSSQAWPRWGLLESPIHTWTKYLWNTLQATKLFTHFYYLNLKEWCELNISFNHLCF